MADFAPGLPQRRATPNLYTVLLATATLLLAAGSGWISLTNMAQTSGEGGQGDPFKYVAK